LYARICHTEIRWLQSSSLLIVVHNKSKSLTPTCLETAILVRPLLVNSLLLVQVHTVAYLQTALTDMEDLMATREVTKKSMNILEDHLEEDTRQEARHGSYSLPNHHTVNSHMGIWLLCRPSTSLSPVLAQTST